MFVRPMTMKPALRRRVTTIASLVACGPLAKTTEPAVVTDPATSNKSLIDTGMPANGGSDAPIVLIPSTQSAVRRASSE